MTWGGIGGAAVGVIGGALLGGKGSSQSGTQTATNTQTMDPRVSGMLFGGSNGNGPQTGLLDQYKGLLGKPQNAGINTYGQYNDGYLGYGAGQDQNYIRETAYGQMQGATPSPVMPGSTINAPTQNNMNLAGSYDKFINGDAGANPYLTNALQGGMDQSRNVFNQMQGDARSSLDSALGGIRSNSVLSGQYGGSRQGIAEGNAIGDFAKAQQQTINQFGQNNTNAAVGAQAQSFNQGQDRGLAATQGLGAQQYGAASQNSAQQQAANQTNVGAQLQSNALNSQVKQQGMSNLSGILGTAYNAGQNQDGYGLHQAQGVNGLLAPYLGQVPGSSTSSQPLYQNTAGNLLGGATAGLALGQKLGGLFGGSGGVPSSASYAANDWLTS